ncbi:unnamed protein product [Ambrosiozyma monospora]|uniref:Unnamed protein product n=1 Tax=Ambrosiozyma monospora TaxID=43982 RepID=A0ACB5TXT9_AMBMO|nr:unnamed protein product [Ambrosiozyma monospora]
MLRDRNGNEDSSTLLSEDETDPDYKDTHLASDYISSDEEDDTHDSQELKADIAYFKKNAETVHNPYYMERPGECYVLDEDDEEDDREATDFDTDCLSIEDLPDEPIVDPEFEPYGSVRRETFIFIVIPIVVIVVSILLCSNYLNPQPPSNIDSSFVLTKFHKIERQLNELSKSQSSIDSRYRNLADQNKELTSQFKNEIENIHSDYVAKFETSFTFI